MPNAPDAMLELLERRAAYANALDTSLAMMVAHAEKIAGDVMADGLRPIAAATDVDRIVVYRIVGGVDTQIGQIYRWAREEGGTTILDVKMKVLPKHATLFHWLPLVENGDCVSPRVDDMSEDECVFFSPFGLKSVLLVPVFVSNGLWGVVAFQDHKDERHFDEDCTRLLRSAAHLCVNAVIRAEMERTPAEVSEQTREAEKRMQVMLDAVPLSCNLIDKDYNLIDCNREAERLFCISSKQEYLNRFFEFSPEYQLDGQKSRDKAYACFKKTFDEGYNHIEWLHANPATGELFPCEVTLVRVNYKGDYIIAAYTRDVRELRSAQSRMREADEHMRHENERFKGMAHWYESLLDAIPFLVSAQDLDGHWTFMNTAAETFLGRKRDEIVGLACNNWGLSICDTDKCAITCAKRGRTRTYFSHEKTSYQVDIKVLKDLSGEASGYIEIIQDITLMERMARQQAETEAANSAKSSFLSAMSHEMRTPMNAIIGMTAIGKNAASLGGKTHALNRIEEASTHLLGVINDVLDISKIEANQLELSHLEFNFEKMIKKVISLISLRIDEKRQQFSFRTDGKVPHFIIGDDQRLTQVIVNLLSNAIKFTPEKGEIRLETSLVGEVGGVCELRIEVTDTGIGITAEQQEKLFRAFGQADSGINRVFGGTGLGLAISKSIVELMGGKIWVESEFGQGSRFVFTIRAPRGTNNLQLMLAPGVNWGNMRLLVVDDDPEIRNHFKELFENLGMRCDLAANDFEACRIIEDGGVYDMYFIGWRMSGIDGLELIRKIKSHGEDRPAVAVMISSIDWAVAKDRGAWTGVDKYLLKPLFSSSIIDCINECLGLEGAHYGGILDASTYGEFEGKRLLLAEDIEINREVLLSLLEDTGIRIDCAANGIEAVDMAEAGLDTYDVVFMDLQMPKMDGLEATRQIRALAAPRARTLPIIAMTANVFKSDIDECHAAGMNDHIGKPYDIVKVLEMLRKYL